MTITGSNTSSFGFQKLGSNDSAGYSTINEVVDGIDTILNASDRLIKAGQTPTVAFVVTGDGVDFVAGLVVTASITDLNVTTGKLADLAVTTGKIAANAVTLGAKTSGDYVASVAGTANQIASSGASSGVGTAHTLSLESSATLPGAPTVATAVGSYPQSGNTARVSTVQYVNDAVANVNASGSVALSGDVGGTAGATVIGGNKVTNAMLATAVQAFLVPTGTVSAFAGLAAPTGYLLCDGTTTHSTTTYAALFGIVNYTYGGSGGVFGVPDLMGRTVIGVGTGTEITGVLGALQGVKEVTLSGAQSGTSVHNHPNGTSGSDGVHSHTYSGTTSSSDWSAFYNHYGALGGSGAVPVSTSEGTGRTYQGAGGGHQHSFSGTTVDSSSHSHTYTISNSIAAAAVSAHTNIQPSLPLNYIIKT